MHEIVQAYGFIQIESKNPHMVSYRNQMTGARLNYYFTSGTVQIQSLLGDQQIIMRDCTPEKLEIVLAKEEL